MNAPPPSRRRIPSAAWFCMRPRSRSTSRATTVPTTAIPTTPSTTPSADLMSNGRTSRLYRALVRTRRSPSDVGRLLRTARAANIRISSLSAVPAPRPYNRRNWRRDPRRDRPPEERRHQRRRTEDDQDPAKANLIRGLADNQGLAAAARHLPVALSATGASCSESVDRIDKVTKADIRRVANQTFVGEQSHCGHQSKPPNLPPACGKGGAQ